MVGAFMTAIVSKGEFAAQTNVTPTRVGQWIREGKISGEAIVGEGRFARINVDVAMRQLNQRRDPSQAVGNGLDTRLTPLPSEPVDTVADALKNERLRALQFQNARAAEEAFARRGEYVRADATAAAMTRVAAKMLQVFEGAVTDIAGTIAAKHGLDRHAVLHEARQLLRTVRAKAADAARREANGQALLIEDLVPDATDPAAGEA
jgi:hypothetical protein